MSASKFKPSKVPLYTGDDADTQNYLGALHNSLFTKPTYFDAATTGISGLDSAKGMLVNTGRAVSVSVELLGSKTASGATVQLPVNPVMKTLLRLENIGDCRVTADGLVSLPNFSQNGSLLLSGELVEA